MTASRGTLSVVSIAYDWLHGYPGFSERRQAARFANGSSQLDTRRDCIQLIRIR